MELLITALVRHSLTCALLLLSLSVTRMSQSIHEDYLNVRIAISIATTSIFVCNKVHLIPMSLK